MTTNTLGFTLPILDAHHHFWDLGNGICHFPWLTDEYDDTFFLGDYRGMCKDFLPPQYREATAGFNVIGTVHVEAERSRKQQVRETEWLTDLNVKTGLPSAIVGHVFFVQPDCDAVLAGHAMSPLARGARSKPEILSDPNYSVRDIAARSVDAGKIWLFVGFARTLLASGRSGGSCARVPERPDRDESSGLAAGSFGRRRRDLAQGHGKARGVSERVSEGIGTRASQLYVGQREQPSRDS